MAAVLHDLQVLRIPLTKAVLQPGLHSWDAAAVQQRKAQPAGSLQFVAAPMVWDASLAHRHEAAALSAAAASGRASPLSAQRMLPQHRRALRMSDATVPAKVKEQLENWRSTTATPEQQVQVAQLQGKATAAVLPGAPKIPDLPTPIPKPSAAPKRRLLTGAAVPAGLEEWAKTATPEQLAQLVLLGLTDPAALPGLTLKDIGGRKLLQAGIEAWLLTATPEERKQAALLGLTPPSPLPMATLQEVAPAGGRKLQSTDVSSSCVPGLGQWAQQQAIPEELKALELLCGTTPATDHTSAAAAVTLQQVVGNGTRKLAAAANTLLRGARGRSNKH